MSTRSGSRRSTTSRITTTTSSSSSSRSGAAGGGGGASSEIHSSSFASPVVEDFDESRESIFSPTRTSRVHEKQALQSLNDRLAAYIDRVRYLENENQRLTVEIRSSEEVVTRERNNIRAAFEAELADARRLLDETARDKAKVQIEADKARAEFDDLRGRIAKLERELKDSEKRRLYSDSMVQDLQAKLNTSEAERKHWEDEAKKLRGEFDGLRKQLDTARRQLEEETLLRVDLENRLQSMREELAFNKQLYEQELTETRRKRDTEITEIGKDLEDQYEAQLQKKLQEIRAQFDEQLRSNRREVVGMYEAKISDLEKAASSGQDAAAMARQELSAYRLQLSSAEKERSKYESMVAGLEKKIRDMEDQLRMARDGYYAQLENKEREIKSLREEIDQMRTDFQDLLDTKIQLDVEIEAYRRLLEGEETRLHLSPGSISGSVMSSSERRGTKRKRILHSEQESFESYTHRGGCQGDIEIAEQDGVGQYVKLQNRGDKDQSIGGFVLKRVAGNEEVTYKFHGKQNLKAGKTLTIYSKSSGKEHKPPLEFVLKNHEHWPSGDTIKTTLTDTDGEEVAWKESSRSTTGTRFSSRTGELRAGEFGDADQRCSLM